MSDSERGGGAPGTGKGSGGRAHILFVDDEPMLTGLAEEMLESLGYRVTAHTSAREALEGFRATPDDFDLIITDLTMPDLAGDRLVEALRAVRPDVPVILASGYGDQLPPERVAAMGLEAILRKPHTLADLAKMIEDVLDPSGR